MHRKLYYYSKELNPKESIARFLSTSTAWHGTARLSSLVERWTLKPFVIHFCDSGFVVLCCGFFSLDYGFPRYIGYHFTFHGILLLSSFNNRWSNQELSVRTTTFQVFATFNSRFRIRTEYRLLSLFTPLPSPLGWFVAIVVILSPIHHSLRSKNKLCRWGAIDND